MTPSPSHLKDALQKWNATSNDEEQKECPEEADFLPISSEGVCTNTLKIEGV